MAQFGAIQHGPEMSRFDVGAARFETVVQGMIETGTVAVQAILKSTGELGIHGSLSSDRDRFPDNIGSRGAGSG
jgi:hypothetical protein